VAGREGLAGPAVPEPDHYAVLEVSVTARVEVIRAAFTTLREIACRDESDNGLRMLIALNHAHRVLTDAEARARYDARRAGT
jgi:curved DNA-binding protein CbpA